MRKYFSYLSLASHRIPSSSTGVTSEFSHCRVGAPILSGATTVAAATDDCLDCCLVVAGAGEDTDDSTDVGCRPSMVVVWILTLWWKENFYGGCAVRFMERCKYKSGKKQ